MSAEDLHARVSRWLDDDPDPDTRAELQRLLDADDRSALDERFATQLAFGTAGIRGRLGAGPNRMNRALVRRVSAGVAARVRANGEDAVRQGAVVGRDARHKSREFAEDAAAVLSGAGLPVRAFSEPVPTPLLAFAVRALGAAVGVQITASHNPASDNGYKVYWAGGAQIGAPLDAEIAAAVAAVDTLSAVPLGGGVRDVDEGVRDEYVERVLDLRLHRGDAPLRVVYTPLHGVAGDLAVELLAATGADVRVVAPQSAPDPDFPTVAFPNPEEPGALDAAVELAVEVAADLVLANDPDGDRIAAAIPTTAGWRTLTGDEIGCLLADDRLTHGAGGDRIVATTVVSSQLLRRVADAHGSSYAETLTGFKWLARVAADAAARGERFVLAYEQALGVMIDDVVRDKDGLSAAVALADLAAWEKARGRDLSRALDDLARRFGVHATAGRALRLGQHDADVVPRVLERLRRHPPREVAGVPVDSVADYAEGVRRSRDGTDPLQVPSADLVALVLADGSRALVRPSGTEPLLKFYVEVVEAVDGRGVADARARAALRLDALADAFLETATA